MKNSTTIVLPQWFSVLQELELAEQMMPRDVKTRWNSTFDMLDFAVEHITAINTITGDCDMKLRQYELSEDEWDMARQLRDVLKVSSTFQLVFMLSNDSALLDLQRRDIVFFPRDTQYRYRHTSHGSHRRAPRHCCNWKQVPSCNQGCPRDWKKNSQPVLWQNWSFWGFQDCYGYVIPAFLLRKLLYLFLVLHPRHKLEYFKNAGWPDDWIEEAKTIVRTQFDLSYGSLDDASWVSESSQEKVCSIHHPQ